MIAKIEKGNVSVINNTDDLGIFTGINVLSYNDEEIPEVTEDGVYLNDLISNAKNDSVELAKKQEELYSQISGHNVIAGANFQAIETTAKVNVNERTFILVATNENFSGNSFMTPLKMFEEKDNKLIDCEIDKIRTTIPETKQLYLSLFNSIINASKERNENVQYKILAEAIKDTSLFMKDNNGNILLNVTPENFNKNLELYKNIYEANKDFLKIDDVVKNKLHKLFNYELENRILANTTMIMNNQVKDSEIKVEYTKIDRYNITAVEPKNEKAHAIQLEYSVRPTIINENNFDKFKTNYVDEKTRKDLSLFIEKAKEDPFVAYHLAKQVKKEYKNDLFTINQLIGKARKNELTTEEHQKFANANENVMKAVKKISETNIQSINFNANYYANNFVNSSKKPEERQISAFFDLLLKTAKGKINYLNSINNITLTSDCSRIRNNASVSSIFYDGVLPKGNAIVELDRKVSLKGTMGKDIVANIQMIPNQIIFPEKKYIVDDKEKVISARLITPAENSQLATKQIINTLSLISKMNENGELSLPDGTPYLIDIASKINKTIELALGENNQLEWKSNIKTKELYENIIKELNIKKDNPADLKAFVDDILDKKSTNKIIKKHIDSLALAIKLNYFDNNEEWKNSVARSNTRIINKKLEKKEFANKDDGLKESVKTSVNQILGKIYDYSNAYSKLSANVKKEENILYQMTVQKPKNIFIDSNIVSIKENNTSFLAPSFNYKTNMSLEDISKKIAIDGKDFSLYVPTAKKIGEVFSNVFQNNTEFGTNFKKLVAEFRTERGEELKNSGFKQAKDESLDISSIMAMIENNGIEPEKEENTIDMLELENIEISENIQQEIEESFVIQNEISDYEEYIEDLDCNIQNAFEEFEDDLEEELGIPKTIESLDNYEEPIVMKKAKLGL